MSGGCVSDFHIIFVSHAVDTCAHANIQDLLPSIHVKFLIESIFTPVLVHGISV